MSRQWMPIYWGDYIKKTMHLSTVEHGAYLLLIAHCWNTGEGIPDKDDVLRRITRTTSKQWNSIRGTIQGFFEIVDGRWEHERVNKELRTSAAVSTSQSAKAEQRWKNKENQQKPDAAGIAKAIPRVRDTTTTTTEVVEDTTSPQTPKHDDRDALLFKYVMPDGTLLSFEGFFERMWLLYPNLRDRGHKGKARDQMLKKLNEGVTYETIGRGVSKYRDYCEATGELQPDFFRWLRDDGFTRPYDIPAGSAKPRSADRGAIIEQQTKAALIESAQRLGLIDG